MTPITCPRCAKTLRGRSAFCPRCGLALLAFASQPLPPRAAKRLMWIMAVGGLAVTAALVLAYTHVPEPQVQIQRTYITEAPTVTPTFQTASPLRTPSTATPFQQMLSSLDQQTPYSPRFVPRPVELPVPTPVYIPTPVPVFTHTAGLGRLQHGPLIPSHNSPFDPTDPPAGQQIVIRPDTARP